MKAENGFKRCSECEVLKQIKYFNRDKYQSDGLQCRCKDCDKARRLRYEQTGTSKKSRTSKKSKKPETTTKTKRVKITIEYEE